MGRSLPKIVVLVAIGLVVAGIYYVTQGGGAPPPKQGVIYIDPGIGAK
jgi:hypothetical protein